MFDEINRTNISPGLFGGQDQGMHQSMMLEQKIKKGSAKITQEELCQINIAKGSGPIPSSVPECDLGLMDIYEHNILVTSWLDDIGYQQKEHDDKQLFYNSEKILNRGRSKDRRVLHHFSKENKNVFAADKHIEFMCKKGQMNHQNQDSFFCVVDGDTKIFGLFDGHGVNGH